MTDTVACSDWILRTVDLEVRNIRNVRMEGVWDF